MQILALSMVVVSVLASLGVAAWAWLAMVQTNDELHSFDGYEGMHFDR